MLSLKVPPPPPWPHIAKIKKEKEEDEDEDEGPSQTPPLDQDVTITPGTNDYLSEGEGEEEGEEVKGETIQKLSEVVNKIRIPKIEHDWKTCISEIENVIKLQPTQEEYNDTVTRQNIEKYKDRLGRDLYECKVNLQKQDEDDKYKEQKRREKAQADFEKGFAMKYNLTPQSQPQSQPQPQPQPQSQHQLQSQSQPNYSSQRPSIQPPQPAFGLDMGEKKEVKKEGEKGIFSTLKSYIVGDKEKEEEEGEEGEEGERGIDKGQEEMIDAVNLYLKSAQDSAMPQTIDRDELKKIDNVIENYKELIENHDILDEKFSKYKETQRLKNFKDTSLINEKEETIENLTTIIKKLEKSLSTYKRNAEKKYIAQDELHSQELKQLEKDNKSENRKVHQFMQDILNERIDNANKIIKEITSETEEGTKQMKKKTTKKRTKSKSKSKSKSKGKKKKRTGKKARPKKGV